MINNTVRKKLIQFAKNQQTLTYSEVAQWLGLSMENPDHRNQIGDILGSISIYEHQAGRPLLSTLVISKELNRPGEGFFKLARDLQKQKPWEDNDCFYAQELKSLFDYWSQNNAPSH